MIIVFCKGHEHLNYERADTATYATISELLKAYSPHFSSTINKQEYLYLANEKGKQKIYI